MSAAGDGELVLAARAGDREAWAELSRRHAPRLAAYLGARLRRPAVVEKLVEDSIVAAWRHLHELEKTDDFAAWMRRIGAHLALSWHRENPEAPLSESFPVGLCTDDQQRRRMERLEEALARLSDAQRMALEQRFRGGVAGAELGQSLHLDAAGGERLVEEALRLIERAWDPDEGGTC